MQLYAAYKCMKCVHTPSMSVFFRTTQQHDCMCSRRAITDVVRKAVNSLHCGLKEEFNSVDSMNLTLDIGSERQMRGVWEGGGVKLN